jgi:DNA end-binding protein Ku
MAALERTLENVRRGQDVRRPAAGDGREELEELSREELYERAQEADVPGRSKMSREELVDALSG